MSERHDRNAAKSDIESLVYTRVLSLPLVPNFRSQLSATSPNGLNSAKKTGGLRSTRFRLWARPHRLQAICTDHGTCSNAESDISEHKRHREGAKN
jgi:hypothetical protein